MLINDFLKKVYCSVFLMHKMYKGEYFTYIFVSIRDIIMEKSRDIQTFNFLFTNYKRRFYPFCQNICR